MSELHQQLIPAKVFILGEYAVLAGGPALLHLLHPTFVAQFSAQPRAPTDFRGNSRGVFLSSEVSSQSAGGKWIQAWLESRPLEVRMDFQDPFFKAGGFGASTAQFLALYRWAHTQEQKSFQTVDLWNTYRSLHAEEEVVPSGADLWAQTAAPGSWVEFTSNLSCLKLNLTSHSAANSAPSPHSRLVHPAFQPSLIEIFSATSQKGRKTLTHVHLKSLADRIQSEEFSALMDVLIPLVRQGIRSLERGDVVEFGKTLNVYADSLREAGLENEETFRDRLAFAQFPFVLGIKGSGAMQSDAMIVCLHPSVSPSERAEMIAFAEKRGLKRVTAYG